eukprot:GHVL01041322.1.p1 GENE.GHVL01041322.1~~GHVL01041322.1.p1  ORF type:complete len:458 (+),score=98.57 GHVL01041322.1:15-1388(+)
MPGPTRRASPFFDVIGEWSENTYYKTAIVDEIEYRIGEVVEIRNVHNEQEERELGICNGNMTFYGEICAFWEKNGCNYRFVEARRYCEQDELPPPWNSYSFTENSIFETDVMQEFSLSCIKWRINIISNNIKICDSSKNNKFIEIFHINGYYNNKHLIPLKNESGELNFDPSSHARLQRTARLSSHAIRWRDALEEYVKTGEIVVNADSLENQSNARKFLRLSECPSTLPCRERELKLVRDHIEQAIRGGGCGDVQYIAGLPGTGKTATVRSVVNQLKVEQLHQLAAETKKSKKILPAFMFVEINALSLQSPGAFYQGLYQKINYQNCQKSVPSPDKCCQWLEKQFLKGSSLPICVLLVDEVDFLMTKQQKEFYSLVDWPSKPNARLVVIAISNTVNLPEKLLPRVASRLGVGRITFHPYNRDQLEKILQERLSECPNVFKSTSVKLCASKVAAYRS